MSITRRNLLVASAASPPSALSCIFPRGLFMHSNVELFTHAINDLGTAIGGPV